MVWDDEKIKQLRKLWEKGLSTTEIAKKMNVSKNSVVGKVHRLCLKARPSPIKKRVTEETVKELPNEVENIIVPDVEEQKVVSQTDVKEPVEKKKIEKVETKSTAELKTTKEVQSPKPIKSGSQKNAVEVKKHSHIRLVELDSHTCRWPIGDPRDEDFCFCGKKVRAGQTYCDEHSMVAYVKATGKR